MSSEKGCQSNEELIDNLCYPKCAENMYGYSDGKGLYCVKKCNKEDTGKKISCDAIECEKNSKNKQCEKNKSFCPPEFIQNSDGVCLKKLHSRGIGRQQTEILKQTCQPNEQKINNRCYPTCDSDEIAVTDGHKQHMCTVKCEDYKLTDFVNEKDEKNIFLCNTKTQIADGAKDPLCPDKFVLTSNKLSCVKPKRNRGFGRHPTIK